MRKILSLLIISAFAFASCNMDKKPYSIDPDGVYNLTDAKKLNNYTYKILLTYGSGGSVYIPEIQADGFHATSSYGNNGGEIYRWSINSTTKEAESQWAAFYQQTAHSNYVLHVAYTIDNSKFTAASLDTLANIKSDNYFARAYAYYNLATRFCVNYEPATADSEYGMPLVTEYNPTGNDTQYPARATLKETYDFIIKDLDSAAYYNKRKSVAGSVYITPDAILALKARVALEMHNWDSAISLSKQVIESGAYPLIGTLEDFRKMWTNDMPQECIVQLFGAKPNELPSTSALGYINYKASNKRYTPLYVPEKEIINSYDKGDIRLATYFKKVKATVATGSALVNICYKFPGNPEFYTVTIGDNGDTVSTSNEYRNKIKLFRVAEQYLIAAEAYASKKDNTNASKWLNALRPKRLGKDITEIYSQMSIMPEIRKEKLCEFFAEGHRMTDLKRWGIGMERSIPQAYGIIDVQGSANYELLKKVKDDYMFVWPIPKAELDANPQIRGQQNFGY